MIHFEGLQTDCTIGGVHCIMFRAKAPGGWLVLCKAFNEESITFYPDPDHVWDGNSLP